MSEIIELKSIEEHNYLKKLRKVDNTESKTYVLKVSYPYIKVGEGYIMPKGSPPIVVGEILEGTGMKVKSIDYVQSYGYTITFE